MEQFCQAIREGNIPLLLDSFDKGVYIDSVNEYNISALIFAVRMNNLELIRYLVSQGASTRRALFEAIRKEKVEAVRLLLSNVNVISSYGDTPLSAAIDTGNITIIRLLLSAGADINLGESPLSRAIDVEDENVIAFLLSNNILVPSDLLTASYSYDPDVVKSLISKGFSIFDTDENGDTPLTIAVKRDQIDVVKVLLEANTPLQEDITRIKNNKGKDAVDLAFESKEEESEEILALLLEYRSTRGSGYFAARHRLAKGWKPSGFFDIEFK